MLREEQRHGQRRPAPHLTAQVGREHRHQRPDLLSAEQHQHDIQRQVGDEGVKVLGSRGTGAKVEDALQCQQPGGATRQRPALFVCPADGAERRTEQNAENAHRCAVQHFRQNARGGHRTTFFPAKVYSRYWSRTAVKRPWGSGTSARLSMVMLLAVMLWMFSMFTR